MKEEIDWPDKAFLLKEWVLLMLLHTVLSKPFNQSSVEDAPSAASIPDQHVKLASNLSARDTLLGLLTIAFDMTKHFWLS